jgi:histidine triad (HIT) family protein
MARAEVGGGDCAFCAVAAGGERSHVVLDEPDVLAFLDHRPVFKGHMLVIPRIHVVTLSDLPYELLAPVFGAVARCATAVMEGLGAEGSWIAENNIVSQAVPHLHVHVVPRRRGDGLRGFFWPRQKYEGDEEMLDYATRLRAVLA